MKITNKVEIKGTLKVENIPIAPSSNNTVLIDDGGVVKKKNVGTAINYNYTDFISTISYSFPNIFNFNTESTPTSNSLVVSLKPQLAGLVFASHPTLNGTPAFRKLVDSDLSNTSLNDKVSKGGDTMNGGLTIGGFYSQPTLTTTNAHFILSGSANKGMRIGVDENRSYIQSANFSTTNPTSLSLNPLGGSVVIGNLSGVGIRNVVVNSDGTLETGDLSDSPFVKNTSNGIETKNSNSASGDKSLALGDNTKALQSKSVAIGYNTITTKPSTVVIGENVYVNGLGSQNIGYSSSLLKSFSINIGSYNINNATMSGTFGIGLINETQGQYTLGRYNKLVVGKDFYNDGNDYSQPVVVVGVGKSETERKNAWVTYGDGRIDYDTTTRNTQHWNNRTLVDKEYVDNQINIVGLTTIGVRNLILNSKKEQNVRRSATTPEDYINYNITEDLLPDTDYTLTWEYRTEGNLKPMMVYFVSNVGQHKSLADIPPSNVWMKNKFTFRTGDNPNQSGIIRFDHKGTTDGLNSALFVRKVKLEKGIIASDWSPAPEDFFTADWSLNVNNGSETRTNRSWFDYNMMGSTFGGVVASFSGLNKNYRLEIGGMYNNPDGQFYIRTRNGDNNTWNPPRELLHSGNIQWYMSNSATTAHTHTIANITNLQTELNNKANVNHTHTIAQVTNLQTELNSRIRTTHVANGITSTDLSAWRGATTSTIYLETTSGFPSIGRNNAVIDYVNNVSGISVVVTIPNGQTNGQRISLRRYKHFNYTLRFNGLFKVNGNLQDYYQFEPTALFLASGNNATFIWISSINRWVLE